MSTLRPQVFCRSSALARDDPALPRRHNAIVMKRFVALVAALSLALSAARAGRSARARPRPRSAFPTADGATVALETLRGKVVYVDFWASWCGPCRRSFPWMNEMQQKYGERGFAVVAVNVDKKRADAERFLGADPGRVHHRVRRGRHARRPRTDVKGMPSSYLVDRARATCCSSRRGFRDERKADARGAHPRRRFAAR